MQPQLDGFEMIGRLAEGGMAEVWLAEDVAGDRWALKVLRLPDERLAERMRSEGALQGALSHPNLVSVVEVHEDRSGRPVLQMPYVAGPSLERLLAAVAPLSIEEIDAIARDVLAGVASAHAARWVHRDLKPANVLLEPTDDGLVARVTDFGLAGLADDAAQAGTLTRHGAGTRRYMSREQVTGEQADPKMDVFALGALLWELVEGTPAFADLEVWRRTVDEGTGPPLTREVPDRMREAIAAALSGDRPADASALRERWADGEDLERAFRASTLEAATAARATPEPAQTAPTVASPLPRRRGGLAVVLGLIGLVAVAAVGWRLAGRAPEPPEAVRIPQLETTPAVQRRFALAWEQFADARLDESEQTLRSVVRSAPDLPDVYVLLALTRAARGRYQVALEALGRARVLAPPEDRRTHRLIGALERSMFRVSDGDPWPALIDDYPDDLMIQAVGCAQLGLRADADRACARARALDDLPVMSWVRGQWALWDDQHAVARTAIDTFLAGSPDHPLGLLQDGWWHAAFGEWAAVGEAANRALQIDAGLAEARLLLAYVAAHEGDPAGRAENLALALGQTTSLPDRVQLGLWDAEASVGLGQIAAAEARLTEVRREAREGGDWYGMAKAALEQLEIARLTDDADRLGVAVERLDEAAEQPGVALPIVRRVRAAAIYGAGVQAALQRDVAGVRDAERRLRDLDSEAIGWVRRDRAVAELFARAEAQEGRPEPLLDLARSSEGCEGAVRGGVALVRQGHADEGRERLRTALTETCPWFGYSRYLKGVARQELKALAEAVGETDEAKAHGDALRELWPDPASE